MTFDETSFQERYAWRDTLDDKRLIAAIRLLTEKDLELLTFLALEEHSQKELAELWGCLQRAVSKQLQKIRKIFQKRF